LITKEVSGDSMNCFSGIGISGKEILSDGTGFKSIAGLSGDCIFSLDGISIDGISNDGMTGAVGDEISDMIGDEIFVDILSTV